MTYNNRYITLCNSEQYLKGALVLYESLNATQTTIPLVILCTKKTPESVKSILKKYAQTCLNNSCKLEILEVELDITLPSEIAKNNKWLRWNGTFDKILVFGLSQFSKLVFIDCDMLILNNIDHLFSYPHMAACFDGQYDSHNLNSGLMVIEPSSDYNEINRILGYLTEVYHNTQFGDQDIIRLAYPEWRDNDSLHLSEQYNLFFENVAKKKKELGYDISTITGKSIYVVHFIGYDKPWHQGKELKWKIYNISWKTRLLRNAKKEYNNNISAKILCIYNRFLKTTIKKLNKMKVKIYEMH